MLEPHDVGEKEVLKRFGCCDENILSLEEIFCRSILARHFDRCLATSFLAFFRSSKSGPLVGRPPSFHLRKATLLCQHKVERRASLMWGDDLR